MMHGWLKKIPGFTASIRAMLRLVWGAQPGIFLALLLITLLQGVLPLGTAWLTKWLFDRLAAGLQNGLSPDFTRPFVFILLGQALLMVIGQMLPPLSQFLNAELGRKLTVSIQRDVYQTIHRFAGIGYFENPAFYDTFRLAVQGAQFGPSQTLATLTNLGQSLITLAGFIGILVAFSPLLAFFVALAALPQLVVQLKMGRERFGLAFDLSPDERRIFYHGYLLSNANPAKEIRVFGLGDYFLKGLMQTYQQIHAAQSQQERREMGWKLGLEWLATVVSSGAFVVVVWQALAGRLTLGDVTLKISRVSNKRQKKQGCIRPSKTYRRATRPPSAACLARTGWG